MGCEDGRSVEVVQYHVQYQASISGGEPSGCGNWECYLY
jgi:hypothetical protein